jgi:short-subunit dehydrogenase
VILVTGASAGIGLACARELLERTAAAVLITGRSRDRLERACTDVAAHRRARLETMACDQDSATDVAALADRIRTADAVEAAVLTVGVNPVYSQGPRRIHALDAATIAATIRTNCTHTLALTSALLDRFRCQRAGVLVWIGSQAPAAGLPGAGLYCATKSFLSGLARVARNEYAARGVRVHLVHPGLVRTPRTAAVADAFAAGHGLRVAEAPDVARQIVDLVLDGDGASVEVNLC